MLIRRCGWHIGGYVLVNGAITMAGTGAELLAVPECAGGISWRGTRA